MKLLVAILVLFGVAQAQDGPTGRVNSIYWTYFVFSSYKFDFFLYFYSVTDVVFFDIGLGNQNVGRVEIGLFGEPLLQGDAGIVLKRAKTRLFQNFDGFQNILKSIFNFDTKLVLNFR